jgi:hypothetical protein
MRRPGLRSAQETDGPRNRCVEKSMRMKRKGTICTGGRLTYQDAEAGAGQNGERHAVLCPWVRVQDHGHQGDEVAEEDRQDALPPGHACRGDGWRADGKNPGAARAAASETSVQCVRGHGPRPHRPTWLNVKRQLNPRTHRTEVHAPAIRHRVHSFPWSLEPKLTVGTTHPGPRD